MRLMIKEWIYNITAIAILAALVNMVLPNGSIKKYTDFVFGLIILVIFLQPLLQITGQFSNLETTVIQKMTEQISQSATYIRSQAETNQRENLKHFMKTNLEKNLAFELEYKTGLNINRVNITFDELYKEIDFSNIKRIDIYYTLHKSEGTQISQVVIDSNNDLINVDDNSINSKIQEIKEIVAEIYNIDPKFVYVHKTKRE